MSVGGAYPEALQLPCQRSSADGGEDSKPRANPAKSRAYGRSCTIPSGIQYGTKLASAEEKVTPEDTFGSLLCKKLWHDVCEAS